MSVPFITQQGNGVYNDCGPACVAMLAKWLGRLPVVATIAAQIDTAQDGTTGWDVGRGLTLQGLTPVYVATGANVAFPNTEEGRNYPYIQLVWYPDLPRKAPGYETYRDYHWINRLKDGEYHDPLFPNSGGANIQTTKAVLDAAYRSVKSGPSIIGIKERPLTEDNIGYDAEALVEWTIRDDPDGTKIGVFSPGAKFRVLGTLTDGTGKRWAKVQRGAGGAPVDLWDGTKRVGPVLDYVAEGSGWRKVQVITPPPDPIPSDIPVSRLLGLHALGDDGAADRAIAGGAKAITLMSGLHSYQLAQGHRDVAVMYRLYTTAPLTADDWCRAAGFDPNGSPNAGDYRYILGMNEYDVQGFGGSVAEIKARAAWDKRRVEILRRVAPNAKIVIGGFPHGNPDFTQPAICQAMKDAYAPIYNNQDPANPTVFFNLHNYTKSKTREDTGPKATPSNWYGVEWFECRYIWLFTQCGFKPLIRAIVTDETGGELGAGSFNWASYTNEQFAFWCSYYRDAITAEMTVAGKAYPSPVVAGTIFQNADAISGQGGHWGGYFVTPGYNNVLGEFYRGTRRTLLPFGTLFQAQGAPEPGYVPAQKLLISG